MNVVFLMNEYSLHNHLLSRYLECRPEDRVSVVKVPMVMKGKSRIDSGRKILPQLSPRFVVEKCYEFFLLGAITLSPKVLRRGEVFRRLSWIAARHGIPYLRAESITGPACLEFIRAQRPDIVVTLMHQIVKGELLRIPALGIVNIHPGLLPDFRGIQPYFWALSTGSGRTGATLHLIEDEGIDTGAILAQTSFSVPPRCSVSLAYYLTMRAAAEVLPATVRLLSEGKLSGRKQGPDEGAYYRFPDRAAFQALWRNGHTLVRASDIFSIITGRCDAFTADRLEYFTPTGGLIS